MKLTITREKGKLLNDRFSAELDQEFELERLVKNVFEIDSAAKIGFGAEEWAHMGYDCYDITANDPIDKVLKDIEKGIVFKIRIELAQAIVVSCTSNLCYYSVSKLEDMSDDEILEFFKALFK